MKDLLTLAKERYSVRDFQQRQLAEEDLQYILEAGQAAPTAVNYQPQRIYVVQSQEGLEKLRKLTPCTWNAPTVLLVCADVEHCFHSKFAPGYNSAEMDASIVGTHMMLAAADRGIGSTWVLWFTPEEIQETFALPENVKIMFLMPLGYPGDKAAPGEMHASTKPLEEMVTRI